ncbi:MAG: hypothetical protein IJZ94_05515 [Clostridia bacterium]|nr:hypothetical protein [Clostridia bacterium]
MKHEKDLKNHLINLIFPAIIFGSTTGVLTGAVVMLYKFCANHIIHISEEAYTFLREHLYYVPLAAVAFFGAAFLIAFIHKKHPTSKAAVCLHQLQFSEELLLNGKEIS